MKKFVVSEETEELVGIEIVEDGSAPRLIIIRDINTIDSDTIGEYSILRSDIPKMIEGLKLFMEK